MICSIFCGAIFSVLLNDIFPGWSILFAGIVAGSLGYFIFKDEVYE